MEDKNSSRMYAVQAPDGVDLDGFVSEEDMDSAAITHVPTINAKVAQPEDQFETRRRTCFGIQ
jgi:outer membrane murein-binding lipoprotein Lpp